VDGIPESGWSRHHGPGSALVYPGAWQVSHPSQTNLPRGMAEVWCRFIVGLSSGLAVCLVPPFLALIARSSPALANRTGQIGFLNQMGIVIGLFSAQAAGLVLTGSVSSVNLITCSD